jgi:hypothetical protein
VILIDGTRCSPAERSPPRRRPSARCRGSSWVSAREPQQTSQRSRGGSEAAFLTSKQEDHAFLANALPHLGNGISGHPFQSPFASPPWEGLSSSTVNVLWGLFNLAVGYLLVCRVGSFDLRRTQHVLVLGVGILVMSVMLARALGRFHGRL